MQQWEQHKITQVYYFIPLYFVNDNRHFISGTSYPNVLSLSQSCETGRQMARVEQPATQKTQSNRGRRYTLWKTGHVVFEADKAVNCPTKSACDKIFNGRPLGATRSTQDEVCAHAWHEVKWRPLPGVSFLLLLAGMCMAPSGFDENNK
jgi:hypothetical protein